jgi:GNAT superfamily N-acetyltransferase
MSERVEIISVDESNLESMGFFCYKSKRKTEGYARKLSWVRARLAEGIRLNILFENGVSKGFIEYIPGEYAWRAVNATGYLFIHCMWVVGRAKGKDYGSRLLNRCVREAKGSGYNGVAVLSSPDSWLTNADFFHKSGFEVVDKAPPAFSLLARSFNDDLIPTLPTDWYLRREALGSDLTVFYTDQCPYIDRMKNAVHKVAGTLGIPSREVYLTDSRQVQDGSPSPYGVYNIVHQGDLIASRPIGTDALLKIVQSRMEGVS